jgi:site-specific recombinase XerD
MLFDWLVTGQVVPTNPAHAVRGPKHVVKRGKTPVLEGTEWRKLLASIPSTTLRDLRDRALIATLTYSFARINAALKMKVEDLRPRGAGWMIRLSEKGGGNAWCRQTRPHGPPENGMSLKRKTS